MSDKNVKRRLGTAATNSTTAGAKEVIIGDGAGNALFMLEYAAPTDSEAGAAKGCICVDTATPGVYVNTGTAASSTWKELTNEDHSHA